MKQSSMAQPPLQHNSPTSPKSSPTIPNQLTDQNQVILIKQAFRNGPSMKSFQTKVANAAPFLDPIWSNETKRTFVQTQLGNFSDPTFDESSTQVSSDSNHRTREMQSGSVKRQKVATNQSTDLVQIGATTEPPNRPLIGNNSAQFEPNPFQQQDQYQGKEFRTTSTRASSNHYYYGSTKRHSQQQQ
jgi:hypothetical protein